MDEFIGNQFLILSFLTRNLYASLRVLQNDKYDRTFLV